ncbi:MAG: TldD/PmbA family protein, partial [Candidatus Hodarchaeota archaeon]
GADMIIGRGSVSNNGQIRFSQGKIDINKQWRSNRLEFALTVNKNHLVIADFSPTSSVEHTKQEIDNAIAFAQKIEPSPLFMGVEDSIKPYPTVDRIYDKRIETFTEESPELVNIAIEAAINAGAKRVAGSLLFGERSEVFISSNGPKGEHASTYYNLTVRAFQEVLDSSGQGLTSGCMFDKVNEEFSKAGERAGNFSKAHDNCVQGKPGTYDLILSPAVAGNLIGGLIETANPIVILMGQSPFKDKLGEQIAPDFVNAVDNPLIPNGLDTSPYDFEGTPHQETPIIEKGVLVNFVHNTSSAKMFGTETTGNCSLSDFGIGSKLLIPDSTNIEFNNGDQTFDELLEGSKPTIYVTCNWYTRFTSAISTEFSTIPRDAMFLVENGEVGQPIKNVRISDNLLRMLKNIEAMARDRVQVQWWEVNTPTFIPTLKIRDCRITTATI